MELISLARNANVGKPVSDSLLVGESFIFVTASSKTLWSEGHHADR